jgi:hypothetical protein
VTPKEVHFSELRGLLLSQGVPLPDAAGVGQNGFPDSLGARPKKDNISDL